MTSPQAAIAPEWYSRLRSQTPAATLLLVRRGDFYESMGDDATVIAPILGLTVTRMKNGSDQLPMCGFPYHQLDGYLQKLVHAEHKVAVCESE